MSEKWAVWTFIVVVVIIINIIIIKFRMLWKLFSQQVILWHLNICSDFAQQWDRLIK